MTPRLLCLLFLLPACSTFDDAPYRVFELNWTCLSAGGCERTNQVEIINRANINDGADVLEFYSTRNVEFIEQGQMVASDMLPPDCALLYAFSLFSHELQGSRFCYIEGGIEVELSIPNRITTTESRWLVRGREIDPYEGACPESCESRDSVAADRP